MTAAAAGCTMTPEPGNGGLATGIPPTLAALPTNIPVEVTVVAVEQPVAPPPGASTPLPYPPPRPQPTPPYLGPSPYPGRSQIAPSPTPTAAIYPVDDCAAHPGFTRCGGAPLTGKLAYFSPDDQLTVLDFAAETAWRSSQTGLQDVSWSPEGNLLLTRSRDGRSYLYQADGVLFDYAEYPLRWSPRNNRLLSGSAIWSPDDAMSASIVYVEGKVGADGRTRAEQVAEIYLPPGESPNPIHWPLSDPAFPDQYFVLLDWAPRMDWLLIGRGFGGSAAQQTAGFRLLALNARAGEILD
ncbi:MAG TPA: hypothetical protein ENK32_11315, partial [Anaerolineae bacterium]|nr:hypothetical protein [Anaerolineae bacterium]